MEQLNQEQLAHKPVFPPPVHKPLIFPSAKKELLFSVILLILSCLLCNSMFYSGLNLGFSIFSIAIILCTAIYLLSQGKKPSAYSITLLAGSLVLAASFSRGDNPGMKFIIFCFLLLSSNLSLCLIAGQNRRDPSSILSLLDVPRTAFVLGVGKVSPALGGLKQGFQEGGTASRNFSAIALGLVIATPLLIWVISLLMTADAAFESLLQMLPDWELSEIFTSIILGAFLAIFLYSRGTALQYAPKCSPDTHQQKPLSALTINTVLIAVGLVYLVYLFSQLAYFSGGFSGILPEDYTAAEYARRGFFEMGRLCAINLAVIALAIGLSAGKENALMLTKCLCLFLGIVTLFLVASASAKMFLYIGSFGLTRLRVLTEVVMIGLGLSTLTVCLWLFIPKIAYMKVILLLALTLTSVVAWADVDTVVARYNVNAYLSGKLDTVDVHHLGTLGSSATPYLLKLTTVADASVFPPARVYIKERKNEQAISDIREWNYADARSDDLLFWYE